MPPLADVRAANAGTRLGYTPVALFVGGTSGIGQATAEALARYTNGDVHIILSGRNKAAATRIIAGLPKSDKSKYEFLPCEATLLSNVSASCRSLTSPTRPGCTLAKLNYLFLSPGFITLRGGRNNTPEGLDKKFALNFYARWKYVMELMPLLRAATDAGEDARVVSVLGAGHGANISLNDIGLGKTYSPLNCFLTSSTYNSLMVEEFARQNPVMSFTHAYPGVVSTGILSHWTLKRLNPLIHTFMTSPQDCAEWMIRPLFDPAFASGAFHLDNHAEHISPSNLCMTDDARNKVYRHLIDTVETY